MTKNPAYAVVTDSDDDLHSDVIIHGQVIVPLLDHRKRELGLTFVAGTFLGGLSVLLLLLGSGWRAPQQVTASSVLDMPPVSHFNANGTVIYPLKPPPQNETQSVQQQQDVVGSRDNDAPEQNKDPPSSSSSSWWSAATSTVSGWFGGGDAHHSTKVAGGGRDWLIDAQTGTVATKLNPAYRLGIGPAPLILVWRDSEDALVFFQSPTLSSNVVDLVVDPSGEFVGFAKSETVTVDGVNVFNTVVSPFVEPLSVAYEEENFLVYDGNYVLDVTSWKVVEGQTVNFVKALDGSTFTKHGGRDWVWNADGGVSPKLNKELALGRGPQTLIITQRDEQALRLSHAQELANGDTVPMELVGAHQGIGAKVAQCTSDGWLTRETVLVTENPIRIKYDGNFILTSDEDFALDIAEWQLEQDTFVRFVGGTD